VTCIRCGRRLAFPGLLVCAACAEELVGQLGRAKLLAGAVALTSLGYSGVVLVLALAGGAGPR